MKTRALISLVVLALLAGLFAQNPQNPPALPPAFQKAEKLFKEQHWMEARTAYDEARAGEGDWHSANARRAVEGAVACSVKLQLWDDALARAVEFTEKTKGSYEEAVGQRFLGGLFLTFPHQGLKQGGKFLRGQSGQGVYVYSWKKDRKDAVLHYERARDMLEWLIAHPDDDPGKAQPDRAKLLNAELIGVDFDLAAALAQQNQNQWGYGPWAICGWWWPSWGEAEEDSEAVEEADYEEPRFARGWYGQEQETPTGIPLGPDGRPQFLETPKAYSPALGAGPKIRFLLDEIQRLDTSPKKEDAAKALFRWAMIARSLYGPETAQWSGNRTIYYDRRGRPYPQQKDPDEPKDKIWELTDDEALTMAGGKVRKVTLPPSENPIAILRQVEEKYPESAMRVEAHYARALYLQTRQQFPQAVAEYKKLLASDPQHPRATAAQHQIQVIGQPGLILGPSGVVLPGPDTKLSFTYRNAEKIEFKALKFDMVRYIQDKMEKREENYWDYRNIQHSLFNKEDWKQYLGETAAKWTQDVPREPDNRAAEGSTVAPLAAPGAFIIEATTAGAEQPSRVLLLATDIAIVQKDALKKGLIIIADARTGQPLPDKAVRIYEHWSEFIQTSRKNDLHVNSVSLITNKDGVIEYQRKYADHGSMVDAIVTGEQGRMAFSFFQSWTENDPGRYWEQGPRYYAVTDRPVYRPGSTVKFRVWIREIQDRKYAEPRAGADINVAIRDAKNNEVQQFHLKGDETGAASGEFQLGEEPPLGVWHLTINGYQPDARRCAGGLFRVEEYKKPEFEVTVKPATTQARLGEKIMATIAARYYFGAPVAEGKVSYKVYRENYQHVYLGAGEYDWLYGKGYGRYVYRYPWFPWWGRWGGFIYWDGPWPWAYGSKFGYQFPWGYYGDNEDSWSRRMESGTRKALRELVSQGEAALKPDGTYEMEIDTARAKLEQPDRDHRYTVEAEVRDASRRTIEGKGSVLVTRQEFYAFVETDGGWYRPGNETFVEVRTLTPDNVPVAAKGEVSIARIRFGGPDNRQESEEIVKRWNAETDADGRLSFKYPIPGEGQYRITFTTSDSWKEEVQGNSVFWVSGPKFDGRVYRFNDLEIIADKRTYKIGETAHLLVNVAENNSRVLFSDNVSNGILLSWRFLDIPSRSMVIDVPIEAQHVPNFFVEATLVRNGRVHSEARELFVPPDRGLLNMTVRTDKEIYRPGDKGKVRVEVTDSTGKPASGDVTLTAYDEAVTYIQDEFGPSPRVFFYGQKRYHHAEVDSSLDQKFNPSGLLHDPQGETYVGGEPEGWRGFWGLEGAGLTLNGVNTYTGATTVSGGAVDALSFDGRAERSAVTKSAAGLMAAAMPMSGAFGGSFAMGSLAGAAGKDVGDKAKNESKPDGSPALIEPEVRSNFADTALWMPRLVLDKNGVAETEVTFPQSLTTWRLHGYVINRQTKVGDSMTKATTTKNLIVRLQAPRFFIERDEVVLSANVNNYLKSEQAVKAELIIPAGQFQPLDGQSGPADNEGNVHLVAEASVATNGEHRFDWPVKVLKPGMAKITAKALTSAESDGMRMAFPVLVHGINKQIAQSGSYRVTQDGARTLKLDLPAEIDPEQTRLEVTLSPSLAGVMIDALPYLVGYPYGCVEQTMSRFYPTVLVAGTLKKMGTDLEAIGKKRKEMNAGDLQHRFGDSPVFDSEELARMTRAGLQRIYTFQRNDGGWGWWKEDDSSPFQTAYVLQGLNAARTAGVNVDAGVYDRGLNFLQNSIHKELEKPKDRQQLGDLTTQAYLAYILSLEHRFNDDTRKWLAHLYEARGDLNNYGRALLALAMHNEKKADEASTLLRNLLQFVERDDSNETAWVRTPQNYWWYWWNNDIETNAWALKAIVALDPKSDLAPRLVKWLLNNRRNGHYWRSTRDTAQVIAAMTDYMAASGEAAPDYALTVAIDGQAVKEVRVNKDNFFTFDNRVLLQGLQVKPGPHEVTLTKTGTGALYYSSYLSYFTKEEDVKGAGNEIFVEREYFKLVPKVENVNLPANAAENTRPANQPVPLAATGRTEQRAVFTRVPLKTGDTVTSGDQIEVVLKITAKNTYDYLAFEDMKPAGCEPVELRSGGRWAGGLCANLELRDEKVVFFIGLLEQGQHILRYKLRAETPGKFHALPTAGAAMYAPEVRAISDEMRLGIKE